MATDDRDLDELLDAEPAAAPAPRLVSWGWGLFLLALTVADLLCLIVGTVPWSGGQQGLHREGTFGLVVVGLVLGAAWGLLLTWAISRRSARFGVTDDEAALAGDEFDLLMGARRETSALGRLGFWGLFVCAGVLTALFVGGPHGATPFVLLFSNGVGGLALPLLWRRFRRANAVFRVWLDERNAPFDPAAADRAAAHRERVADIRARLEAGERTWRERLARFPRVPPPWYVSPSALWAPLVLAVLVDVVLLFAPRGAHLTAGGVVGHVLVSWFWGAIGWAVIWGLLSWSYIEVADQVSRRWSARDWSAGLSAIGLEVALGLIAVFFLAGLFGGWAVRLVCWNLIAPSFAMTWLIRDIRRTAREHYARSMGRQPSAAPAVSEDEEEV